jgi:hypothetical protein
MCFLEQKTQFYPIIFEKNIEICIYFIFLRVLFYNIVYTLFFIILALQSENYNKKCKLKYLFRSNLCH